MTFTNFCEQILLAIYQENQGSDGWVSFGHLKEKYGLSAELSWSFRAMEYLKAQGWIDGRSLLGGTDNSVLGRMTGPGMVYIEAKYGSKDGVGQILEPVAQPELVSANSAAEPQVVLADTVEAEIIPASDRLVRLDHNSAPYKEISQGIFQLREEFRGSNDLPIEAAERTRLKSGLDAAVALWNAVQLKVIQVKVGVIMAIEDIAVVLIPLGKAVGAALLVDAIKALIKTQIGVDLDHI